MQSDKFETNSLPITFSLFFNSIQFDFNTVSAPIPRASPVRMPNVQHKQGQ